MRSPAIATLLVACLGLSGCTSSSGFSTADALSLETTGSIPRPDRGVPGATATADLNQADASGTDAQAAGLAPDAQVEPIALAATPRPAIAPPPPAGRPKQAALPKYMPGAPVAPHKVYRQRFGDAKPINFGRVQPADYPVHGVDVSRWQGNIDWARLRSRGANFVFIKATDGGDHLDPMFKKNWRDSDQAGLKRGAYHFFYWCRTGAEQADWFIRNVPKVEGALPPVIDVEWNGESSCKRRPTPAQVREKMQVFMDRLEAHYGQRPIIYTAPDFYRDNLQGAFTDYPFWLRAVAQHPSKVYPNRKWLFWQYSGSGLSQGVNERIDLNVFNGDEKVWRSWLGGRKIVAAAQ